MNEESFLAHLLYSPEPSAEVAREKSWTRALDFSEVTKMRQRLRRDLSFGFGTAQGLSDLYPKSLAYYRSQYANRDPIQQFLESEPFHGFKENAFSPQGTSLEEAFYLFLASEITHPDLEGEFLTALCKELTINPNPSFGVKTPLLKKTTSGWYATTTRENVIFLYAALPVGFVHGAITPEILRVIETGIDPSGMIKGKLSSMGLL